MCSDFYSKYSVETKIGHGTFSEVFKCKNNSTGESFAVKILKKKLKCHSDAETMPELLVMEKLPQHVNVLSLLEYIFNESDRKIYMVFELMERSLYDLIITRKRCLPEFSVKNLFYQILKGVEHLHSNGIFHRDIKPENILITKSTVKLADLGSVRGVHSQQPYTDYISTRWYRAPECILTAGIYSFKVDIWACGCVFYELLTCKPMFPGANEIDQLTKIHQFTGTPNTRVLMKIKNNYPRIQDIKFPIYPSINVGVVLPFTSEMGRDVLKRMLVYDPDFRTTVKRVLEHRYFNDLREDKSKKLISLRKLSVSTENNTIKYLQKNQSLKPIEYSTQKNSKVIKKSSITSSDNSKSNLLPKRKSSITLPPVKIKSCMSPNKLINRRSVAAILQPKEKVKSDIKPGVKQLKQKAHTLGSLPPINGQQKHVKLSKSQVCDTYSKVNKGLLPTIPEH